MKKKILCIMVCIAMIFQTVPAFAVQLETGTKYWKQNFDGLLENTAPEKMLLSGIPANYEGSESLTEEERNIAVSEGADGVFGKTADDTAFKVTTQYNSDTLPIISPNTTAYKGPTLKNDAGSDDKTAIFSGLTALAETDIVHLGFEYAINNYTSARTVKIRSRQSTKVVSDMPSVFLSFGTDGSVKVFSTAAEGFVMPLNQWVKFDFVFKDVKKTGGSSVDMYINGVKVIEGKVFDAKSGKPTTTIDPLIGIANVVFDFPMGASEGIYPLTQTYIDNYLIEVLSEEPQIGTFTLEHSNPEINGCIDNVSRSVTIADSVTTEQFIDGLTDKNIEIVDLLGNVQSGKLCDGYIRAGDSAGTNIYYTVSTFTQNFYINENFDARQIESENDVFEQTGLAVENTALNADTQIYLTNGMYGRNQEDDSLVIKAENFAEGESGDVMLTKELEINDEIVSFEASGALEENGNWNILLPLSDSNTVNAISFNKDGYIYVNGGKTEFAFENNGFYKAALTYNSSEGTYDAYVNGRIIAEGVQAGEAGVYPSGIKCGLSADGNGTLYLDDMKMYSGEYVFGADLCSVISANDNAIVYKDTVYTLPVGDVETLISNLEITNCALKDIYTDMSLAQTGELSDGSVLLFENLAKGSYLRCKVAFMSDVLGIAETSYEFSNENKYIYIPAKTDVNTLLGKINLFDYHTATVTDAEHNQLSGSDVTDVDKKLYLHIEYKSLSADYEIRSSYVNEAFDDILSQKIYKNGEYCNDIQFYTTKVTASESAGYIEGITSDGENVLKLYSNYSKPDSDAKINLKIADIPAKRTKQQFVLTYDCRPGDMSGLNSIVFRYTGKTGEENRYYNLIDIQGGNIKMGGTIIGTYKENQWIRMTLLMTPGGMVKAYVNGKLSFNGTINLFQKLADHIDDIIYTHQITNGERITLIDNVGFYPISNINNFDASPMLSQLTTSYDIIDKNNNISGYGYGTVEEFLALFTAPEGAAVNVYNTAGTLLEDYGVSAEKGMSVKVTSPNGMYETVYTLGENVIKNMQLFIAGRELAYLIEGQATAAASIYSAMDYPVKLILRYENENDPSLNNEITIEQTANGKLELSTESVANVLNEEGEKLTLKLLDKDGNDILEPKIVEYTGRLDFSSEITAAKNGCTSIVTLTMDDGVQGSVEKFNSWYKQYGLRGTSMVWADRLSSNSAFYKKIFDQGYIDLGSHSKSHKDLTAGGITDEIRRAEVVESQQIMRDTFEGQQVICYAPAENRLDAASEELVRQNYWAMRQGKRGYNSLDPADTGTGGWYDLKIQGCYNPLDKDGNECALNDLLDIAASEPMWLIEMYHGVDSGFGAVSTADAQSHFSKLGKMQTEGKLWCASFNEATKYIRQRQNTTITDVATQDSRTISLTMTNLPEDIFNAPLTVKSEIPAGWTYAKVVQGGKIQAPEIRVEDGRCYIYYDAYANEGPITIENSAEKPVVTITDIKLSTQASLIQSAGSVSDVVIDAVTAPADNVDESGLYWFVNDVKVQNGGKSYTFNSQDAGEYVIYLKDEKTGIVSNAITITVKLEGILFEDDFEGYPGSTTVPSTNWYSNATVNLKTENGNTSAEFFYNSAATYPALHKTVTYADGKPVIYNAEIKLVNDGSAQQSFYYEMRNSADGSSANRKTVLTISKEQITAIDGTVIGKIPLGSTVNISMGILAGKEGEESVFKYYLSGSDLTDENGNNKGAQISYQTSAVIDNIAVFDNNKANMLFNNNFSKANSSAFTYVDNVKIYNPSKTLIYPNENNTSVRCSFVLTNDVYFMDASKLSVTNAAGESVNIKNAYINPDKPSEIFAEFNRGVLREGETYTLSLNGAAVNAWGDAADGQATFTVKNQQTQKPVYTFSAETVGGTIYNVTDGEDWQNKKTGEYEAGRQFELRADENDDAEFLYWKDNNSGRILSYSKNYKFSVGTGKSVTAVFAGKRNDSKYITFRNANGEILASGYAAGGVNVPSDPYICGYVFDGWYLNGEKQNIQAGSAIGEFDFHAEFRAGFTADETLYTVSVTGADKSGGSYKYNTRLTYTSVGENFAYWTKNGQIVSYNKTYSFYVTSDLSIEAVYGESVQNVPVLVMAEPVVIAGEKIAFFAERDAAGYTVIESGILLGTESGLSLENYVHKAVAASTDSKGQFTVRKKNPAIGETWYGKAYMIYTDENNNVCTIYSNEVSKAI